MFRCAMLIFAGLAAWLQVMKDQPLPCPPITRFNFFPPPR